MPYNPGIQNIAGQLYAQAGQNFGQSLAAGLQQYQQNKIMANQAIGQFEAAVQANPDILQFLSKEDGSVPDGVKSAYQSLKTGGSVPIQKAAMLSQFAQTYAQQKSQAQEAQMRQMQIESLKRNAFIAQQQEQLRQQYADPNFNPQGNRALMFARDAVQATGQLPTPQGVEQFLTAKYGPQTNILETTNVEGTNAKGQPIITSYNKRTGEKLGERVVAPAGVLMPEDQAKATEMSKRAEAAVADNNAVIEGMKNSASQLYNISRAENLIKSGAQTGALADVKATAQNLGAALGVDLGNPSNIQELNSVFGNKVVEMAKGLGRVTNFELNAFNKYSASLDKTPEANMAILGAVKAAHQRNVEMGQMVNDLRRSPEYKSGQLTERDLNDRVNDYIAKNPLPIPGMKTANPVGGEVKPTAQSVLLLKQHPELAAQFDERYGKGAADFYLKP